MSGKYETQEKKKTWLILLLIICIVICIGVTIWALFFRQSDEALIPDYAPQETEQNARPIEGDDDTKLDAPEGGSAIRRQSLFELCQPWQVHPGHCSAH